MVLRRCDISTCNSPVERYYGSCMICARHMCAEHVGSKLHACPSMDNDPGPYYAASAVANGKYHEALLARINVKALETAASSARDGISCRIPALANHTDLTTRAKLVSKQTGAQNCHLDIEFTDGVTWLARIHLDDPLHPPLAVRDHIFLSEVATLEFLAKTEVPAPHIYAYEPSSPSNPVGTPYILMEKLAGTPLNWKNTTPSQRSRVTEQLADIYIELSKHPLPLTGSLFPSSSPNPIKETPHISSFAQPPCFETPTRAAGPFKSLNEAYTSLIHLHQRMLITGEIAKLPVDHHLALLWRLKALPGLVAKSVSRNGPFYLRHYDDTGSHILVDGEYNITGIIDWEFASAEAKELAFTAPCMMWSVEEFYGGRNEVTEDEERFAEVFKRRGRGDMAEIVRAGRRWQRFLFFLGGGVARDMEEFKGLFQGLRESFAAGTGKKVSSFEEWRRRALAKYGKRDAQLQVLLRRERAKKRTGSGR